MARANRHYLPGYVWHITHRCHKREFLLKFARGKNGGQVLFIAFPNPEGKLQDPTSPNKSIESVGKVIFQKFATSKEPRPQGGALKNFKTILIVSRGDHLDDI